MKPSRRSVECGFQCAMSALPSHSGCDRPHYDVAYEGAIARMVLWPLLIYFLAVTAVVALMIGGSYLLGERHSEHATGAPYESGIMPTDTAHPRFRIQFYLVAMFFVIFDVEAVFLVSWAVAARDVGWAGYLEAGVFTLVLVIGLVYLWRMGALDWGSRGRKRSIGADAQEETDSK